MYSTMTMDEWVETFKPTVNPNNKWGGSYSAYETYGDDYEVIKNTDPSLIWTEVDGEGGSYIINGWHYVNRIQYYVCEVPTTTDAYMEVVVCLYKECDCVDEEGDPNPDCTECESGGTINHYPDSRADLIEIYGEEYANASV